MTSTCLSRRRVLGLAALIAPLGSSAQRAIKTSKPRIGILWLGEVGMPGSGESFFHKRLRQLGWVGEQNVAIESRFVGGGQHLSREVWALLAKKVDVIVAMGSPIARVARSMTRSVPIVFLVYGEPVELGLVDSLSHPGGNLTGIYLPTAEHAGKRLGLLHEVAPRSTRIGALKFSYSRARLESSLTKEAAEKLGVQLVDLDVSTMIDFESAFHTCVKSGATALTILSEPRAGTNLRQLAALSLSHKLPSIAGYASFARLGGLMAYGADPAEGLSRAAYLVAKILNGAQPADLPVEQSTKYVLGLNMKTAKELGVSFPKSLLQNADVVIS